jgi:hypothetical protein
MQDEVHTPRSGRANRGPRKQVFVAGDLAQWARPVGRCFNRFSGASLWYVCFYLHDDRDGDPWEF